MKILKLAASVIVIIGGIVCTWIVNEIIGEAVTTKLSNWIAS